MIGGIGAGGGAAALMPGVYGMLGVMSLMEAKRIYDLKTARLLHTHPLFETARTWRSQQRDEFGVVNRINVSTYDDDVLQPRQAACCLCCILSPCSPCPDLRSCIPCPPFGRRETPEDRAAADHAAAQDVAGAWQQQQREQRQRFIEQLENRSAQNAKTVRQLEDEQVAAREMGLSSSYGQG